jgi:NNP family nitrate/nitrite transporter-like MFS transporter
MAFRESFAVAKSGVPAFYGFLAFYVVCAAITYAVYLRKQRADADVAWGSPAYSHV